MNKGKWSFSLYFSCLVILLFISCNKNEEYYNFKSYNEAIDLYLKSGELEWMYPTSTLVLKAAYHSNDEVMIIYFLRRPNNGYIYGEVPRRIWAEFKNVPSKGKYYRSNIKGHYLFNLKDD